jgi:hypothetical protein
MQKLMRKLMRKLIGNLIGKPLRNPFPPVCLLEQVGSNVYIRREESLLFFSLQSSNSHRIDTFYFHKLNNLIKAIPTPSAQVIMAASTKAELVNRGGDTPPTRKS